MTRVEPSWVEIFDDLVSFYFQSYRDHKTALASVIPGNGFSNTVGPRDLLRKLEALPVYLQGAFRLSLECFLLVLRCNYVTSDDSTNPDDTSTTLLLTKLSVVFRFGWLHERSCGVPVALERNGKWRERYRCFGSTNTQEKVVETSLVRTTFPLVLG